MRLKHSLHDCHGLICCNTNKEGNVGSRAKAMLARLRHKQGKYGPAQELFAAALAQQKAALDECRYDAKTAQPVEGSVVDADEDLVALCSRMQAGDKCHCAILFCEGGETTEALATGRPQPNLH